MFDDSGASSSSGSRKPDADKPSIEGLDHGYRPGVHLETDFSGTV